jgi:hypothetical protein
MEVNIPIEQLSNVKAQNQTKKRRRRLIKKRTFIQRIVNKPIEDILSATISLLSFITGLYAIIYTNSQLSKISEFEGRLSNIESRIDQANIKVSDIDSSLLSLSPKVNSLNSSMVSLNSSIDYISSKSKENSQYLVSTEVLINRITNQSQVLNDTLEFIKLQSILAYESLDKLNKTTTNNTVRIQNQYSSLSLVFNGVTKFIVEFSARCNWATGFDETRVFARLETSLVANNLGIESGLYYGFETESGMSMAMGCAAINPGFCPSIFLSSDKSRIIAAKCNSPGDVDSLSRVNHNCQPNSPYQSKSYNKCNRETTISFGSFVIVIISDLSECGL